MWSLLAARRRALLCYTNCKPPDNSGSLIPHVILRAFCFMFVAALLVPLLAPRERLKVVDSVNLSVGVAASTSAARRSQRCRTT